MNSIELIRRSMRRRRKREENTKQLYASVRSYPGSKDCSVCKRTIISEAMALPCRHTVCKQCISDTYHQNDKGCPKCKPKLDATVEEDATRTDLQPLPDEGHENENPTPCPKFKWKYLSCCSQSQEAQSSDLKTIMYKNGMTKKSK